MRPLCCAHLLDDLGDTVRIGEVDAEVVRRAAGGLHRVDRGLGGLRPLQRRQFFFHQRRRGPLAARLDAREQIALQAFFVADEALEVGIVRIGLRHQIEQIEGAAGCGRQIGGDGRDDASRCAGDQEDACSRSSVRPGWPSAAGCSCKPTVQRSPSL